MLRNVRRRGLALLKSSGIFEFLARSRWRQQRLLILCYHGVSIADEHEWNRRLYMSQEALRGRFEALRRGRCNVLPLGEALDRLTAGTLPPCSVSLTFDDGAYDFYARAVPLIDEYGFPATLYLTTYYVDYQRPVFDTGCSYVLWRARHRTSPVDFGAVMPGTPPMCLETESSRRTSALRIRDYARSMGLTGEEKDDLLRRIAERVGVDYDEVFARRLLFLMTRDEVRDVAESGIDVQLHSHRHRAPHDCHAFTQEIEDNRAGLDAILGPGRREHFCYPNGIYNQAFVDWLEAAGIVSATTCDSGLASARDARLLLPRLVDTMNIAPIEFEAWLCGLADLLPHRRLTAAPVSHAVPPAPAGAGGPLVRP